MWQGQHKTITWWTQTYITDFLSEIGGLFTSLIFGFRLLFLGYQRFVSQLNMLKSLYGEED